MFKDMTNWVGNAVTNAWDWTEKAGKAGLEFAWSLPSKASEIAEKLSEMQTKETAKTIEATQRTAQSQQEFLASMVSPTNLILVGMFVFVIILVTSKK